MIVIVKSLSHVRLFVTPWTVTYQALRSTGFSRQEYWSGLPFPSPRYRLPTPIFLGFPCGSAGKESACNVGDLGLIPGLGRSPGEGKGYPLQYSGLENSIDCIVHGVAKSQTQLSDFHSLHSRLVQWFVSASHRVRFVPSVFLFVFPLMGKDE